MKKIILSLVALCAVALVSCGGKAMGEIENAVKAAIEQTQAATSIQEVGAAGLQLEAEMQRIQAEAGDGFAFTGEANKLIEEYQKTAEAKLAELGVQ